MIASIVLHQTFWLCSIKILFHFNRILFNKCHFVNNFSFSAAFSFFMTTNSVQILTQWLSTITLNVSSNVLLHWKTCREAKWTNSCLRMHLWILRNKVHYILQLWFIQVSHKGQPNPPPPSKTSPQNCVSQESSSLLAQWKPSWDPQCVVSSGGKEQKSKEVKQQTNTASFGLVFCLGELLSWYGNFSGPSTRRPWRPVIHLATGYQPETLTTTCSLFPVIGITLFLFDSIYCLEYSIFKHILFVKLSLS